MAPKALVSEKPVLSAANGSKPLGLRRTLSRTQLVNDEGSLTFSRSLQLVLQRREDHYVANAPTLGLSAIGETEAEALELLEETIVASYFFYVQCSQDELHRSALPLRAAFEELVESAAEPQG